MSFPIVQAASTTIQETCHFATDVVQGTRYAGNKEDSIRGNRGCRGASNFTSHQHALKNKSPPIVRCLIACLPLNWRSGLVLKTNGVRGNSFISEMKNSE